MEAANATAASAKALSGLDTERAAFAASVAALGGDRGTGAKLARLRDELAAARAELAQLKGGGGRR